MSVKSIATLLSSILLATTATAHPPLSYPHHNQHDHSGGAHNGQCRPFTIPVPVKTTALDFHIPPITNAIETVQWAVSGSTWSTVASLPTPDNATVDDIFNIYGQLCVPHNGAKKNILHLATHGLVYDSRYWDVEVDPEQYSYVYNVLEQGYSILTYDRLTTGKSDKPDGYIAAQGIVQVEILRYITEQIRSGDLLPDQPTFDSIVHVGHSFGSFITDALLALYGELSDGAILTGFIPTTHPGGPPAALGLDFARTNDPKFGDRPDAYVVPARDLDIQTGFFSALANTTLGIGGFDPALLVLANSTKQPGTVGELTSLPLLATSYGHATEFTGPVQFMEGVYDYIICSGDCHDWNQAAIDATFVNAKDVEVYLQPGTGHGLTMHRNASAGYQVTFDFLSRNGL